MTFTLSIQQEDALRATEHWLTSKSKPFFYLAGFAGTGKTSIAKRLVEGRKAVFAAFTGKAAEVMERRGCKGATTIHRLIYMPKGGEDKAIIEARARVVGLSRAATIDKAAMAEALKALSALRATRHGPRFELWRDNPALIDCDLIVIDEVSMVPHAMMSDLMSFGKPILILGDPAQLPPVKGGGFIDGRDPDKLLTEVHRQAAESGVLQLATMIREGVRPALGRYGTSVVCSMADLQKEARTLHAADQILCGYNKTKDSFNQIMRGRDAPFLPVTGDKLVCLRNNHDRGFYNGSTMIALDDARDFPIKGRPTPILTVEKDGEPEMVFLDRAALSGAGAGNNFDLISLDYAWAMTCHKAQGSQWGKVLVLDESNVARENAKLWLYTAVTRAQDSVVLVLS